MKRKKVLAMGLATMMAMSCVPATVFAEEVEITGETELANDKYVNHDATVISELGDLMKEASGIEVEISTYPDTASYQTYIQQSIRGEDAPGLFTWWSGAPFETLVKNDLLEDLTDLWNDYLIPAGVSPDVAKDLTVDGKVYGAVDAIIYDTVFYNKKVFEQAGVEVPTTFDEFLNVCESLKAQGITPIALKSDSWAGFIWFERILAAKSPQLYRDVCDGTKKYTDPEVVEAMNVWKDMFDKGYFSRPMDWEDCFKQFAEGEVAMMSEMNMNFSLLINNHAMVPGEDLASFVLPSMNGDKGVIFTQISPLCVAKASEDKGSAIEVLKKYYDDSIQNHLYKNMGYVNTANVEVTDAAMKEVAEYVADQENYELIMRYYENTPEEIRNVALDELMRFQLGDGSVEDVLNNIQKKADEVWASLK